MKNPSDDTLTLAALAVGAYFLWRNWGSAGAAAAPSRAAVEPIWQPSAPTFQTPAPSYTPPPPQLLPSTNLAEDINSGYSSFRVGSTAGFPNSGLLKIDNELISFLGYTDGQGQGHGLWQWDNPYDKATDYFTGKPIPNKVFLGTLGSRGQQGTTNTSHASGAAVTVVG